MTIDVRDGGWAHEAMRAIQVGSAVELNGEWNDASVAGAQSVLDDERYSLVNRIKLYDILPDGVKLIIACPVVLSLKSGEGEEAVLSQSVPLTWKVLSGHSDLVRIFDRLSGKDAKIVALPPGTSVEAGDAYLAWIRGGDAEALRGSSSLLAEVYNIVDYYGNAHEKERVITLLGDEISSMSREDRIKLFLFNREVVGSDVLEDRVMQSFRGSVATLPSIILGSDLPEEVQQRLGLIFFSELLKEHSDLPYDDFVIGLQGLKSLIGETPVDIVLNEPAQFSDRKLQAIIDSFPNRKSVLCRVQPRLSQFPMGVTDREKCQLLLGADDLCNNSSLEEKLHLWRYNLEIFKSKRVSKAIIGSMNEPIPAIQEALSVLPVPLEEKQKLMSQFLTRWLEENGNRPIEEFEEALIQFKSWVGEAEVDVRFTGNGSNREHLEKVMQIFPHMKTLYISHFSDLTQIPPHLTKLEKCQIRDCRSLHSIEGLSGAPLKSLILFNLPNLVTGCTISEGCLFKVTHCRKYNIVLP